MVIVALTNLDQDTIADMWVFMEKLHHQEGTPHNILLNLREQQQMDVSKQGGI